MNFPDVRLLRQKPVQVVGLFVIRAKTCNVKSSGVGLKNGPAGFGRIIQRATMKPAIPVMTSFEVLDMTFDIR